MTPILTANYAAVLAHIFVAMSLYVISIRRHGNMTEYLPFTLLMVTLAKMSGLSSFWLHACGLALIAGRLIHPIGVNATGSALAARVAGVLATIFAILVPAIAILLSLTRGLPARHCGAKLHLPERNDPCDILHLFMQKTAQAQIPAMRIGTIT